MTVPVHGLPPLVTPGMLVALVPPTLRGDRWHRIRSCRSDARSGSLVSLEGVASIQEAEGCVGRYVLARVSDLPRDLALHDAERLVGREVVMGDEGTAAIIDEVLRGPANDVWVLHGERGELLLPVIPHVVDAVPDEGPIFVRPLEGLVWERVDDAV